MHRFVRGDGAVHAKHEPGVGQPGCSEGKSGLPRESGLEGRDRLPEVRLGSPVGEVTAKEIGAVGFRIAGARRDDRGAGDRLRLKPRHDCPRDLVLDLEDVRHRSIVTHAPGLIAVLDIGEA